MHLDQPQTQALLLSQNKSPTCRQQAEKEQEGKTNKRSCTHTGHPHTYGTDRNIRDGTQSALKPDRHATESRLIQMISQLCCHIREKEHPLRGVQLMTAVVFGSSRPRFHSDGSWWVSGLIRESCFPPQVFVPCQKCPVHTCGISSVSSECCQSTEGGWVQRTTPYERSTDRGSDSTFQMADIARRILVKGSTSPPVCKTAMVSFLSPRLPSLLFSSSFLRLCPVSFS